MRIIFTRKSALNSIFLLLFALGGINYTSFAQVAENYDWKSVNISGGGYVTGFVFSKAAPDILYARTDVGGAYRWDSQNRRWIPLNDMFTANRDLGVLSIAADPKDPDRVYMATGLYSNSWDPFGNFFISDNQGASWDKVTLPCKIGGNEGGRGTGERLQVDPNSTNKLILGSNKNGLFESKDFGKTWSKINSFPATRIQFVEFDESTGTDGEETPVIYVAAADNFINDDTTTGGLYRSFDAGATWEYVPGQPVKVEPKSYGDQFSTPTVANNIAFAGDHIFITYGNDLAPGTSNGFLMKYNKNTGNWTKIYPVSHDSQGGYSGLSVHPENPDILVVASLGHWWPTTDIIYITTDGGETWSNVREKMITDRNSVPHGGGMGWLTGLTIDPWNPDRAVFGSGNGLWMTENLMNAADGNPTNWVYENDNFEETVPLALTSPPTGPELISGLGDIKGFVHQDITMSPANTFSHHGNTYSVDFAESNPLKVVRTHDGGVRASYSLDGGTTWNDFPAQATGGTQRVNYITISPDGQNIVWSPSGMIPSYSTDNGNNWTLCNSEIEGLRVKSDRVNNTVFYAPKSSTGEFFRSNDGGKTFSATSASLPVVSSYDFVPVFGKEGTIWLAARENGLYLSTNSGDSFTAIDGVTHAYRVAVGKAAPGSVNPSVFIYGRINGYLGLFRSDDLGKNWVKINNKNQEFSRGYTAMCGDPKVYGRLYLGIHGRGIMYGEPQGTDCFAPLLPESLVLCENSFTQLFSGVTDSANYNFKWFKNGVSLENQTASILVTGGANYEVVISKDGCPDAADHLIVESQMVDISDVSVCNGETATLKAEGNTTYLWKNQLMESIGTGSSVEVNPESTQYYYVEDTKVTAHSIGLPTYSTGGWGIGSQFDNNQNKVKLSVSKTIKLNGISFHVLGAGTDGVIRLLDSEGKVYASASRNDMPAGTQEIPFDVVLAPGEYIVDAVGTTGYVQFQADRTGANWEIPEYVTLSSVPGWAYGIFFDLKFEVGNTCAPTPVKVTVNTAKDITFNYIINNTYWKKGKVDTLCEGDYIQFAAWPQFGSSWEWTGPNGFISDIRNPLIEGFDETMAGIYSVQHTDSNGCSLTDEFELTLCDPVITSNVSGYELSDVKLFPNPSNGSFYVYSGRNESSCVEIVDLKGNNIFKREFRGKLFINEELPAGVYLVKLIGDGFEVFKLKIH